MGRILLENMEFYAHHGCFKEEQSIGTNFLVTLSFETNTTKAGKSDSIEDTVDYKKVYDAIKAEMQIPSKLLEHLSNRIINAVFAVSKEILSIELKVSKLNPSMGGAMKQVSIQISKHRNE